MSLIDEPDEYAVSGSQAYVRHQLHQQIERLQAKLNTATDTIKKLAERLTQAEKERDERPCVLRREGGSFSVYYPRGQGHMVLIDSLDLEYARRDLAQLTETANQFQQERDVARLALAQAGREREAYRACLDSISEQVGIELAYGELAGAVKEKIDAAIKRAEQAERERDEALAYQSHLRGVIADREKCLEIEWRKNRTLRDAAQNISKHIPMAKGPGYLVDARIPSYLITALRDALAAMPDTGKE